MKIKKIKLENFRTYKEEVSIELNNLTVFVGKNDAGKSTILEALDIFFNEGKGVIKIDKDDVNKKALEEGNNEIKITVIFDSLPETLTIDSTNSTNLANEFLLNKEVCDVKKADLPYPSLNEVNYLAFNESDEEYHNELYGYIESEEILIDYKNGKKTILYKKEIEDKKTKQKSIKEEQKILSEYIRHQIHHPENKLNTRFTNVELQQSIEEMRVFIKSFKDNK